MDERGLQELLLRYSQRLHRPVAGTRGRGESGLKPTSHAARVIITFLNGLAQFRFHVLWFLSRLAGCRAVSHLSRAAGTEDPAGTEPIEEYDRRP